MWLLVSVMKASVWHRSVESNILTLSRFLKGLFYKHFIEIFRVDVIQWSEELYERILVDRTKDACHGEVDVVIDFGTTSAV